VKPAKEQFDSNIARVRAIGGLSQSLTTMTTAAVDLTDLLRMELALAVSALDQFVHELVGLGMLEVNAGKRKPTDAHLGFRIPLAAARVALASPADSTWLDDAIRDAHSWLAFQQPEKIADAVRLVSDVRLWPEVSAKLGRDAATVKRQLKVIVDRRNKIVHEADLDPLNPGLRWPIDRPTIDSAIAFVEQIATTIYDVVA
jgi:hypothetical protein